MRDSLLAPGLRKVCRYNLLSIGTYKPCIFTMKHNISRELTQPGRICADGGCMALEYIIHRQNPYIASRKAELHVRGRGPVGRNRLAYFAERAVLTPDGRYPFGEGYLYFPTERHTRSAEWVPGCGSPQQVGFAGHHGSKAEQQDAFGGDFLDLRGQQIAMVATADGVSASRDMAAPAARCALRVFKEELRNRLQVLAPSLQYRHEGFEWAISQSIYRANFEVIRHVLFDFDGDEYFGYDDSERLYQETGIFIPSGALTIDEMRALAVDMDRAASVFGREHISALTTFAAALAVDSDVYAVSSGDAVVSLYRPTEDQGERLIHLTHRDQQVVELYVSQVDINPWRHVHENIITRSLGSSTDLSATIRRFPGLLEPGDRLMASSDGLGPRRPAGGLDREAMENIIEQNQDATVARDLVEEQLTGLSPGDYQDNISVSLMTVH
jgi:hypothetical protein